MSSKSEKNGNPFAYPFRKREKIDDKDLACNICDPSVCGRKDCSFLQIMKSPYVPKQLNSEISAKIISQIPNPECVLCHKNISTGKVKVHQTRDGWNLSSFGFDEKQWVFIECPHCKYGNSIRKLGVPRDFVFRGERNNLIEEIAEKYINSEEKRKQFISFFSQRFPEHCYYARDYMITWAQRFQHNTCYSFGDSESRKVLTDLGVPRDFVFRGEHHVD